MKKSLGAVSGKMIDRLSEGKPLVNCAPATGYRIGVRARSRDFQGAITIEATSAEMARKIASLIQGAEGALLALELVDVELAHSPDLSRIFSRVVTASVKSAIKKSREV